MELKEKGLAIHILNESGLFLITVNIDLLGNLGLCEQVEVVDQVANRYGGRIRCQSPQEKINIESVLSAERLAVGNVVRLGRSQDAERQLGLLVSRGLLAESTKSEWLGRAHLSNGGLKEAKKFLKESLSQSHDAEQRGRTLVALGETYFMEQDFEQAEDAWIECLATPSSNEARVGLARIRARQGHIDVALNWIRVAVQQRPSLVNELHKFDEFRSLAAQREFQSMVRPNLWQRLKSWIGAAMGR